MGTVHKNLVSWWWTTEHLSRSGHPPSSAENPVCLSSLPWKNCIHIIKQRGGAVSNVSCYVPPLYMVLKYSPNHRKEWHYNPAAAAMQYAPVPSLRSMNMKHIMKQNSVNGQYWEPPIHQCPTWQCLGCCLELQLQWWIQTEIAHFSIKWSNYSISLAEWIFKYLICSKTAPIQNKCTYPFSHAQSVAWCLENSHRKEDSNP